MSGDELGQARLDGARQRLFEAMNQLDPVPVHVALVEWMDALYFIWEHLRGARGQALFDLAAQTDAGRTLHGTIWARGRHVHERVVFSTLADVWPGRWLGHWGAWVWPDDVPDQAKPRGDGRQHYLDHVAGMPVDATVDTIGGWLDANT